VFGPLAGSQDFEGDDVGEGEELIGEASLPCGHFRGMELTLEFLKIQILKNRKSPAPIAQDSNNLQTGRLVRHCPALQNI